MNTSTKKSAILFIENAIERINENGYQLSQDYAYALGAITICAIIDLITLEEMEAFKKRAYSAYIKYSYE